MKKVLNLLPNYIILRILKLKNISSHFYLFYLNKSIGLKDKAFFDDVYFLYELNHPDLINGHLLKIKFLISNDLYKEAQILISDLEKKFRNHPDLFRERLRIRKILEGKSIKNTILENFESDRFKEYLKIINITSHRNLNFKSILVITYGRSGSTLLQGLLNSIPNVTIYGENYNIFFNLFKFFQSIKQLKKEQDFAILPYHAYYYDENLKESDFLNDFKKFVYNYFRPQKPNQVFGFKEIRYPNILHYMEEYLCFLEKIFPNPLFIFNSRNLKDVIKSGWWKTKNKENTLNLLKDAEKKWANFSRERSNCFHITYEDIRDKTNTLKDLFLKIGAEFDEKKIEFILKVPHSYGQREQIKKNTFRDFPYY